MCSSWGSFKARTVTACPNGMIKSTVIKAITPFIVNLLGKNVVILL
jgi:hypothetical protein